MIIMSKLHQLDLSIYVLFHCCIGVHEKSKQQLNKTLDVVPCVARARSLDLKRTF